MEPIFQFVEDWIRLRIFENALRYYRILKLVPKCRRHLCRLRIGYYLKRYYLFQMCGGGLVMGCCVPFYVILRRVEVGIDGAHDSVGVGLWVIILCGYGVFLIFRMEI